jgi:HEPN domain-containing protein
MLRPRTAIWRTFDVDAIKSELNANPPRRRELEELLRRLNDDVPDREEERRRWAEGEVNPDPIQA